MVKNIKDSKQTLELGLKAERDTIAQYQEYKRLAGQDTDEARLWEHLIKDEEEHVRELEAALKGDYRMIQDTTIEIIPQEEVEKRHIQIAEFMDDINDCLVDAGVDRTTYSLSEEFPHFYVDFGNEKEECKKAYEALRDDFFACNFVEDDGFYYIHVLRR